MNLHRLRLFCAVVERGSYAAAARALYISQPAVFKQLQFLESDLGASLVHVVQGRVRPTAQGEVLLPYARRILALAEQTQEAVAHADHPYRGPLRVGATTTPGAYVAPQVLAVLLRDHAELRVTLVVSNTQDVTKWLVAGDLDVALTVQLIPPDTGLVSTPVVDDELIPVASPQHPLALRHEIGLADLQAERVLIREEGSGTRRLMDAWMSELGLTLAQPIQINSTEALKQAIIAGLGVSIVSALTVQRELQAGWICRLPMPEFSLHRRIYVVHSRDRPALPPLTDFLAALREWAAGCAEGQEPIRDDPGPDTGRRG